MGMASRVDDMMDRQPAGRQGLHSGDAGNGPFPLMTVASGLSRRK